MGLVSAKRIALRPPSRQLTTQSIVLRPGIFEVNA
jgi:hypothetical protein